MKLMVVMIIMIMVMTMMRGDRWLILMKVRLSRDFSWWGNAFRCQRTQATLLLISYSDHASKGSTGSCLIESNLFKAVGNFDRIIEIGSFDSPLLDLFDQKQVFGQIWKHLLLLSMLSKKMVTLFDRNVKVVENINSNVSKSQLIANRINHLFFCTPSYLGHNCLDCGSFWGLFATFSNYWLTSSIFHELPWH